MVVKVSEGYYGFYVSVLECLVTGFRGYVALEF